MASFSILLDLHECLCSVYPQSMFKSGVPLFYEMVILSWMHSNAYGSSTVRGKLFRMMLAKIIALFTKSSKFGFINKCKFQPAPEILTITHTEGNTVSLPYKAYNMEFNIANQIQINEFKCILTGQ
eukprot:488219_1